MPGSLAVLSNREVVGAPPSTHDVDVRFASGRVIALEVTRHAVPDALQLGALAGRLDWRFSSMSSTWHVSIRHRDLHRLRRELPSLLESLESSGLASVIIGERDAPTIVQDRLRELGVRLVVRLFESSPGEIVLGEASAVGSTSPDLLAPVAERHATWRTTGASFDERKQTSGICSSGSTMITSS